MKQVDDYKSFKNEKKNIFKRINEKTSNHSRRFSNHGMTSSKKLAGFCSVEYKHFELLSYATLYFNLAKEYLRPFYGAPYRAEQIITPLVAMEIASVIVKKVTRPVTTRWTAEIVLTPRKNSPVCHYIE